MTNNKLKYYVRLIIILIFLSNSCNHEKVGGLLFDYTYRGENCKIQLIKQKESHDLYFKMTCALPESYEPGNDSLVKYSSLLKLQLLDRNKDIIDHVTDTAYFIDIINPQEYENSSKNIIHKCTLKDGFVNALNYYVNMEIKAYYIFFQEDSIPGNRISVTRLTANEPYLETNIEIQLD